MKKQLYYEDIEVGTPLPPLVKDVTTCQLVKWAGASEDFYQIHYDNDFAIGHGLKGVIVHGRLKAAVLGQLLTDWVGERGAVLKLGCRYRGMDYPGKLICGGKVTRKYADRAGAYLECEVWVENPEGARNTTGNATVSLPRRPN